MLLRVSCSLNNHQDYLFSKIEKEKLNRTNTNTSIKIPYQTNVKAVNLHCPS